MDPVTFNLFAWVVGGLAAAFATAVYFLVVLLLGLRADLTAYKLHAKDKFASVGYLKDVEKRLSDDLEHLAGAINRFDATIQELTKALGRIEGRLGVTLPPAAGE